MSTVHIVGPVIRGTAFRPEEKWVYDAYKLVVEEASAFKASTNIPESDRFLEQAEPVTFVSRTIATIEASNVVVTVFTGGNVSVGIEAAVASQLRKKQIIVTDGETRVPRMLRGLPGVVGTVSAADREQCARLIGSFLKDNLEGRTRNAVS